MNEARIFDAVGTTLEQVVPTLDRGGVTRETTLPELGLDSLSVVDLVVDLERRLEIDAFPIQAWLDGEASRDGRRFTVASLVAALKAHSDAHHPV